MIDKLGEAAPSQKMTAGMMVGAIVVLIQSLSTAFDYPLPFDESVITGFCWVAMGFAYYWRIEGRPPPSAVAAVIRKMAERGQVFTEPQ